MDTGLSVYTAPRQPRPTGLRQWKRGRKKGKGDWPAGVLGAGSIDPLEEACDVAQQHGGAERAGEEGVEQEEQEGLVVEQAHAVGHPHAVVVHAQHAAAQHTVVVRALRLPCLSTECADPKPILIPKPDEFKPYIGIPKISMYQPQRAICQLVAPMHINKRPTQNIMTAVRHKLVMSGMVQQKEFFFAPSLLGRDNQR